MAAEDQFLTLFVAADWITHHCVVPDGFRAGQPFELVDWQLKFILNHYRVRPDTPWIPEDPILAPAFVNRRSQLVMPQKAGKGPVSAAQICLEAVGPALFAGWAEPGDVYDCQDHGCACGWVYAYEPGEPKGMPWPTPLIQITATSEEQTDNVYDALRPMINNGPLAALIPRTGEEFIRLPGGGRVDTVTSNARSRLGQRVTFVVMDETGLWTRQTGMVKVAETQRRGLAGMGGRAIETTNSWDPAEESVAQRTAESQAEGIFRLHPLAPPSLDYREPRERRQIHKIVYAGSPWVNLDAIEAEAAELFELDPAQAERFFGNRVVAGTGMAYTPGRWEELASKTEVKDGSTITIGVDGARFEDALAIVATHVETGHQWPIGIWEVPLNANSEYEHDLDLVDGAMQEAFKRFNVWRVYIDPQRIEQLVERWQGRWTEKVVIEWHTNRPKAMAHAVRKHVQAVNAGDLTHDGNEQFARHIGNAVKQKVNVNDDQHRQMFTLSKDRPHSPRKMDAAIAAVLSWECRGDAIAAGALTPKRNHGLYVY